MKSCEIKCKVEEFNFYNEIEKLVDEDVIFTCFLWEYGRHMPDFIKKVKKFRVYLAKKAQDKKYEKVKSIKDKLLCANIDYLNENNDEVGSLVRMFAIFIEFPNEPYFALSKEERKKNNFHFSNTNFFSTGTTIIDFELMESFINRDVEQIPDILKKEWIKSNSNIKPGHVLVTKPDDKKSLAISSLLLDFKSPDHELIKNFTKIIKDIRKKNFPKLSGINEPKKTGQQSIKFNKEKLRQLVAYRFIKLWGYNHSNAYEKYLENFGKDIYSAENSSWYDASKKAEQFIKDWNLK